MRFPIFIQTVHDRAYFMGYTWLHHFLRGTPFGPQCEDLRNGVHVLVCTPGRLLDHVRRQSAASQLQLDLFPYSFGSDAEFMFLRVMSM